MSRSFSRKDLGDGGPEYLDEIEPDAAAELPPDDPNVAAAEGDDYDHEAHMGDFIAGDDAGQA